MNDYRTKFSPPTQSTTSLPLPDEWQAGVGLHIKTPPWVCLCYFMENRI
jgi:hypothetical protein